MRLIPDASPLAPPEQEQPPLIGQIMQPTA